MSKIIMSKIMGLLFVPVIVSGAFVGAFAATYLVPDLFRGSNGYVGPTGPAGSTGTIGPTGPRGATGPAGAGGTNGVNGTNGTNGTNYPFPLVSSLTFVSNATKGYIRVNGVNASTPSGLTLNIQPHVSYSATWTTLNEVDLHDSFGNTYSTWTYCNNTSNTYCYISGSPTNWAVEFTGIVALQRGESFTMTINGSDSTGATLTSTYTITF